VFRATIKSLLARKLRLVLTALAIVLGVGFMAGTLMLTDTAIGAFDSLIGKTFQGINVVVQGKAAFQQSAEGGSSFGSETKPVPESVLPAVKAVPGVAAADGDISGYAQVVDPQTGKAIANGGAPTLGNSWNPNVTSLKVIAGAAPNGPDQVAIDTGTAADHNLTVGQQVRVLTNDGSANYTISGLVALEGQDTLLGATLAVFDLETAQKVFDRVGQFDRIYVRGDGSVPDSSLAASIGDVVPSGYEAISSQDAADQQAQQSRQALGFLRTGLLVFGFVAVFVGAFIIFNTFTILITQRTRELGLLRAIGASRRQIRLSVLVEAIVVGLVGSLIGLAFGLLLAQLLRAAMSALGLKLPATATVIAPRTIVVALIVGTGITVLASYFPARRASRITPIEALREGQAPPASLRRRSIFGSIVLALGLIALGLGLFGGISNGASVVGLGAALTFLGAAILSPLIARPLASWVGRPARARERDAQPSANGDDGVGPHGWARAGGVRRGVRRLAQVLGVRGARCIAEVGSHGLDVAVPAVLAQDRRCAACGPPVRDGGRVPAGAGADRRVDRVRHRHRPGHGLVGARHVDDGRSVHRPCATRHRFGVQARRRRPAARGRRHAVDDVRRDRRAEAGGRRHPRREHAAGRLRRVAGHLRRQRRAGL
jgi:putative ABC transport system permease protein